LSVQTLYNLFGSREDILLALAQRLTADVERLVANDLTIDDPLDRLRAMFSTAIAKLAAHESTYRPMLLALFRGTARTPERLGPVWARVASMGLPPLAEARERGLLRGSFAEDAFVAHVLESYAWNLQQWAEGFIDHRALETRTLYGLTVGLLALASDDARPRLQKQLKQCERARANDERGDR
jgi:AcrR family transcriptional regulator